MENISTRSSILRRRVVVFSILLFFFALPHTLEDFAIGEPGKAGIPAPILSLVVSVIFATQSLGLYWLGKNLRQGYYVHIGVGLFWPMASGVAQLPTILSGVPYRAGFVSVFYVMGINIVGIILTGLSLNALRSIEYKSE